MATTWTDIFNRKIALGQPLAADAMSVQIPGLVEEDFLAQAVSMSYEQNITRLYEVGSPKTFFVGGRTRGQMTINRVIGPGGVSQEFVKKYGDICNMQTNPIAFTFKGGCNADSATSFGGVQATGVIFNSINYQVQAQDTMVMEAISALVAAVNPTGTAIPTV